MQGQPRGLGGGHTATCPACSPGLGVAACQVRSGRDGQPSALVPWDQNKVLYPDRP